MIESRLQVDSFRACAPSGIDGAWIFFAANDSPGTALWFAGASSIGPLERTDRRWRLVDVIWGDHTVVAQFESRRRRRHDVVADTIRLVPAHIPSTNDPY